MSKPTDSRSTAVSRVTLKTIRAPQLLTRYPDGEVIASLWKTTFEQYVAKGVVWTDANGDVNVEFPDVGREGYQFFRAWICDLIMNPDTKVADVIPAGIAEGKDVNYRNYSIIGDVGYGEEFLYPLYVGEDRNNTIIRLRRKELVTHRASARLH